MAFTETASIFRRIEAALEYDLLGQTTADTDVDEAVNGNLSEPLGTTPRPVRIERYVLDPIAFGYFYASARRTGLTVGYSFSSQTPSDQPRGGTGNSMSHVMPVEVTVLAVVSSADDLIGGARGYEVDGVMDDVTRTFQSGRRKGPKFGVQSTNLRGIQKLEGGSVEQPWCGRTLQIDFRRSYRDLQT